MKTLKTKWTGIRPLLMHSSAMIDPDNKYVRAIDVAKGEMKRLKKDDFNGKETIRRQIERLEWEGSLYWKEQRLSMPGDNILACLVNGARKIKAGKQAESAIVPIDDIPVECDIKAGAALDDIYQDAKYSLRQAVRIPPKTGARIMKVRPMIPTGWMLSFEVEFDEKTLPEKDLIESMVEAGRLIGLGDWRPKFGRFLVETI